MTMKYTQESFEKWIEDVPTKLKYVTEDFAKEQGLKLDLSIASLDTLEKWILKHYDVATDLREEEEMLDLLALYVGETFMKYIGGKWYVEQENSKSPFYQQLMIKYKDKDGDVEYRSIRALCTSSISRNKGNLISSTLKKDVN